MMTNNKTDPAEQAVNHGYFIRPSVNGGIIMEIVDGDGRTPEIASFTTPQDFVHFIKNAYEEHQ